MLIWLWSQHAWVLQWEPVKFMQLTCTVIFENGRGLVRQDLHLNTQEINNFMEPRISHPHRVSLNMYSFPFGNSDYISYKDFTHMLLFWSQNFWQVHNVHAHTHTKLNIRLPTALVLSRNSWWHKNKRSDGNKQSDLILAIHFKGYVWLYILLI